MRYVTSTTAHTTNDWMATAGWADATADLPSVDVRNTYPTPVHYANGAIQLFNRTGVLASTSGRCDYQHWSRTPTGTTWSAMTMLWQGLAVTDGGGPGTPGQRHRLTTPPTGPPISPIRSSNRVAAPHPGRVHVAWVWRQLGSGAETDFAPSYAYSDDNTATWRDINGTAMTVPFTPLNNIAARIPGGAFITAIARSSNIVVCAVDTSAHGLVAGDSITVEVADATYNGTFTVANTGVPNPDSIAWAQAVANDAAGGVGAITRVPWLNWGRLTVDDAGLPHLLVSGNPNYWIRRNDSNTAWTQTALDTTIGGVTHLGRMNAYWLRGHLWALTTTHPSVLRRQRLLRISGTDHPNVGMSAVIGSSGWEPSADPEAYRRHGTIETLARDGNTPKVFTFGDNHRVTAA